MTSLITVQLDKEQLHQVIEGIGHRIDYMRERRADYTPEEIDAARTALDVLTAAAHGAQQPASSQALG
ncbi:hypothetical protein [Pseudomonas sp. RL]|uniref:hypothetical protein n=1 Tax=Pseudomonas sp. RL TaxID=1452718 RepID=UPI0004872F50|nr:hypothetical protein [Pseudomonas sp. RL]